MEFRIGSENSIPTTIRFQGYFVDTTRRNPQNPSQYFVIDSLIAPPTNDIIVAPGDVPSDGRDKDNNIIKTNVNSFNKIIPVSKERYSNIYKANMLIVKGTLLTKDSPAESVKFFTWQTCTFKLSALAKVRIDPAHPDEVINVGK